MAVEIGDKTWGNFLDQHNSIVSLLDTHASLLVEMRKLCEDSSATRALILGRLNTTEKLIATFKQSTESLQEVTNRDEQVVHEDSKPPKPEVPDVPIRETKKPKSQKSVEAVPDPSGFFTIDPNPTPIEQLYKEKPTREKPTIALKSREIPKRKVEFDRPPRADLAHEDEPKRKKPKKNNERKVPPPPTAEDEKEEQPDAQASDEDDDDSFLKAVEARSKAKEEKKKAKADKKRKRQSEDSTEGANGTTNKKKKDKHGTKAEAPAPVPAAPASAGTKPKQQPNEKRPFAQADLEVDENDDHFGPGGSRKRARKGKKSKV